MIKDFLKHASEFRRALANRAYELLPNGGILFNKQKAVAFGEFGHHLTRCSLGEVFMPDAEFAWAPNRVVDTGLAHILNNGLTSTALYIAPFANNVTPAADLVAATAPGTLGEFTIYDEATRQVWNIAAEAPTALNYLENTTVPALFTVGGGAGATVWGFTLATASAKSSTAGTLIAGQKLAAAKTGLGDGDELRAKYRITLTAVA